MNSQNVMVCRKITEVLQLFPSSPSFQRLMDIQRAEEFFTSMATDIKTGKRLVLPGCIIVAKTTSKYWIIDGLHRLEAYKNILKKLDIDLTIYCNEIDVADEAEAKVHFDKVNNTRMLPMMPDGININIVKMVVDHFQHRYPKIFSNSKTGRCNRPHIHFNGFQEALARVIAVYSYFSAEDIIQRITELNGNTDLLKKYDFDKYAAVAKEKGGFYLGIIPSYGWIEMAIDTTVKQPPKRQTIPSSVRHKVWVETNGENWNGRCFICDKSIDITNFHCGHDIAASKGGSISVENLKPVCSVCNLSMGTRKIDEMKEMFC